MRLPACMLTHAGACWSTLEWEPGVFPQLERVSCKCSGGLSLYSRNSAGRRNAARADGPELDCSVSYSRRFQGLERGCQRKAGLVGICGFAQANKLSGTVRAFGELRQRLDQRFIARAGALISVAVSLDQAAAGGHLDRQVVIFFSRADHRVEPFLERFLLHLVAQRPRTKRFERGHDIEQQESVDRGRLHGSALGGKTTDDALCPSGPQN